MVRFIGKVYVIEHLNETDFNPDATFCVDIDLVKKIGLFRKVEDFHLEMKS